MKDLLFIVWWIVSFMYDNWFKCLVYKQIGANLL